MVDRNSGPGRCWRALANALAVLMLALAAPAMAADPPPPLDAYGDLPGIEQMSMSPSGAALAIVARVNGERRLVVLDAERKARAVFPIGEAKVRGLDWADEGHLCLTISRTENLGADFTKSTMEFYYSAVFAMDGSKPRFVFANVGSMSHGVFGNYGFRTVDGKAYGYFAGLTLKPTADRMSYEFDRGQPALFAVDIATMAVRKVANAAEEGHDREWLVDAKGAVAATLDISHDSGTWRLLAGNGALIASGKDVLGHVGLVALGGDGASVIYSRRGDDGEKHWYQQPFAGGPAAEIFADVQIKRIFTDPGSGRMIGYEPDAGNGDGLPVLIDTALQTKLRKVYKAFPGKQVEVEDFTADIGHVLVHTNGNADPGMWFSVDLAARKADPIGDDRPLIPNTLVGPISMVEYKAADGTALRGVLTLPPGRDPHNLPVVMLPHGGPHAYDEVSFDWWAQALASRGYAVFQPNFRGSTDRDVAFMNLGNGEWGRKMQTDISDGLAELAKQGVVDPKRACIVGASYGGYAALAGVTLQKGFYRCAVAVAGVSDLSEMYETDITESGDDRMTKRNLQVMLGNQEKLKEVSPRRFAAQADAPVLLIHGKDDTVVPFRQSDRMLAALQGAKKPVEMVVLLKEDHWLSRAETRKQMLEACVRFVLANNPPG